ncbi:MAG TPA: urease accessory protein UreE [Geminicoccus sp.]|uniref:urease accessory protein UreE n=1 Tax=Geminicoccus sp. TaxID=2024832 RepID=UPI002E364243|nr:urease accessory protein UreE [Geminicoccus sp.]HEX2526501.1 urease accessory protein UreE [Geminicoccus sp.]
MDEEVGTLTLTYDDRHRRRVRLISDQGVDLLLDLPRAAVLEEDDGLLCEQGGWFRTIAAAEPVLEVQGRDATHLARLAWHLGNRHTPAEIRANALRVRQDHVLEAMLTGLGGCTRRLVVPFTPERGAYDGHHHG